MKQDTLSNVQVGDLLWDTSYHRQYIKLVTKVTDSMVYSRAYCLIDGVPGHPDTFKTMGIKNLKAYGDGYDGGAEFPLKGNEQLFELGREMKEKKTYKHRGVVRDTTAYKVSLKDAKFKYDFYLG